MGRRFGATVEQLEVGAEGNPLPSGFDLLDRPAAAIRGGGEPTRLQLRTTSEGQTYATASNGMLMVGDIVPLTAEEAQSADRLPTRAFSVGDLRATHHEMARLMVLGYSDAYIAQRFSLSLIGVGVMKRNPAFAELLAHYSANRDEQLVELQDKIQAAAMDGLDRLHQTITAEEDLTPGFIRQVTMDLLDRAGHAPVKRAMVANFTARMSTQELEEIKRGARGNTVIHSRTTIDQTPSGSAPGGRAAVGGAGEPSAFLPAPEGER